jgi:Asp-tRNA(Asn)/Glu-tRNA(Gln) amidotransferase A subunit family amidase
VSAFRDWLQQYDSTLHAAVTITYALADSQAAAAQQAITSAAATTSSATANTGKDAEANDSNSDNQQQAVATGSSAVSLLSGVPYGLKDLFAVPGYPTTWGLSALKNRTIDTVRPDDMVAPC